MNNGSTVHPTFTTTATTATAATATCKPESNSFFSSHSSDTFFSFSFCFILCLFLFSSTVQFFGLSLSLFPFLCFTFSLFPSLHLTLSLSVSSSHPLSPVRLSLFISLCLVSPLIFLSLSVCSSLSHTLFGFSSATLSRHPSLPLFKFFSIFLQG